MEKLSRNQQWATLIGVSRLLRLALQYFHVPAALLLGPMIVGVAMGRLGATQRIVSINDGLFSVRRCWAA